MNLEEALKRNDLHPPADVRADMLRDHKLQFQRNAYGHMQNLSRLQAKVNAGQVLNDFEKEAGEIAEKELDELAQAIDHINAQLSEMDA